MPRPRKHGDEPLNQTVQVRFKQSQVALLDYIAEQTDKRISTIIREIVIESIDEVKDGIIRVHLPPKMNIEINKSCDRLGITKEEFITTIVIYKLSEPIS